MIVPTSPQKLSHCKVNLFHFCSTKPDLPSLLLQNLFLETEWGKRREGFVFIVQFLLGLLVKFVCKKTRAQVRSLTGHSRTRSDISGKGFVIPSVACRTFSPHPR